MNEQTIYQHGYSPRPYDETFGRLLAGGRSMRRDDDYLRDMLAAMEAAEDWLHQVGLDDDEPPEVADKAIFHARLLEDEGFLERVQPGLYRMTSKGHDFVSTTRDAGVWAAARAAVGRLGGHSVTMLANVAEGLLRAKLREVTGLDV